MTPCWSPNFPQTSRNDVQPHDNLRTLLSIQFFRYKVMSENSGLTHAKDCDACSLWKDVPLHNFLTYIDVFAWKCSHRSTCLHTTCHTISYVVLDRHVSTQCVYYETYSCACSHTKRRVSVHFLITKSCLCVTLNISHLVCHVTSHRCSRNKVPHHDFLQWTMSFESVKPMFSDIVSCVKSWIQRRFVSWSRVVVRRFDYKCGLTGEKDGVIC